jgi:hypothetical protein
MQVTKYLHAIQIRNNKTTKKPACAGFSRAGGPALFDLIHNGLEGVWVVHGEVRQHLAVQFDSFL